MNGPGTDQYLFENDDEENDEPEVKEDDEFGWTKDDVDDFERSQPGRDHKDY